MTFKNIYCKHPDCKRGATTIEDGEGYCGYHIPSLSVAKSKKMKAYWADWAKRHPNSRRAIKAERDRYKVALEKCRKYMITGKWGDVELLARPHAVIKFLNNTLGNCMSIEETTE